MPSIAVVVSCHDLGCYLEQAIDSVLRQTHFADEVIVVDDGSEDPFTRRLLARLVRPRTRTLRLPHGGVAAARNAGVRAASADLIVLLDADDLLEPRYLELAHHSLVDDQGVDFVTCPLAAFGAASFLWKPPAITPIDTVVRGGPHISSMFRRALFDRVGGFDPRLSGFEDTDFWAKAVLGGARGTCLDEPLVRHRVRVGSRYRQAIESHRYHPTMAELRRRHASGLQGRELLLATEKLRRDLHDHQRHLERRHLAGEAELDRLRQHHLELERALQERGDRALDLGQRSAVTSANQQAGTAAALAASYLREHALDVSGRVLVLGRAPDGLISDRCSTTETTPTGLAELETGSQDAILVLDVLHRVADPRAVLAELHRILAGGGVMLLTTQTFRRELDGDEDRWRFTAAAVRRLLSDEFTSDWVEVETRGNLTSASAELGQVSRPSAGSHDPVLGHVIGARAVEPIVAAAGAPNRGVILAYHRVADDADRDGGDPHQLAIPTHGFAAHLDYLRRACRPLPLDQLVALARRGRLPERAVAVTFDDGYLDALTLASPLLLEHRVPATFFTHTERLDEPHEAWWDTLARVLLGQAAVPPSLALPPLGRLATATQSGRRATHDRLHGHLLTADAATREQLLSRVIAWSGRELPPRSTHRRLLPSELRQLAHRPGHEVGAHGHHHLLLPRLAKRAQRRDLARGKDALERALGSAVTSLAYPFGEFTGDAIETARELGFRIGVAVVPAAVTGREDPLALPRLEVSADTDDAQLEQKLGALFDGASG